MGGASLSSHSGSGSTEKKLFSAGKINRPCVLELELVDYISYNVVQVVVCACVE